MSHRGRVPVAVFCPATATGRCAGRVRITAPGLGTIASRRFNIGAGNTRTLRLRLTRAGRTAVRLGGGLAASIVATAHDGTGVSATTRKALKIKL
jgi:hypothetical protein